MLRKGKRVIKDDSGFCPEQLGVWECYLLDFGRVKDLGFSVWA